MEPIDIQALGRSIHEVLILAVVREGPKHGYQIALDVEEATDGVFSLQHGTLYPILHRLEKRGDIKGQWASGGRKRKVYVLTAAGRSRLESGWSEIEMAFEAVREAVGGGS